jgi:hypothetical protein
MGSKTAYWSKPLAFYNSAMSSKLIFGLKSNTSL